MVQGSQKLDIPGRVKLPIIHPGRLKGRERQQEGAGDQVIPMPRAMNSYWKGMNLDLKKDPEGSEKAENYRSS